MSEDAYHQPQWEAPRLDDVLMVNLRGEDSPMYRAKVIAVNEVQFIAEFIESGASSTSCVS